MSGENPIPASPDHYGGFRLVGELSRGGYGVVHKGIAQDGSKVAIKVSTGGSTSRWVLELEIRLNILLAAAAKARSLNPTFPIISGYSEGPEPYMITPLRGPSLAQCRECKPEFAASVATALIVAVQGFHMLGVIHRDITASNVVIVSREPLVLELVDLAFCKSYRIKDPVTRKQTHHPAGEASELWGTAIFASTNAEAYQIQSRRDDMEAAAYVAIWLRRHGRLPWSEHDSSEERIRLKKSSLADGIEPVYANFIAACQRLKFEEEPSYWEWRCNFSRLLKR